MNKKQTTAAKAIGRPERLTLSESRDMLYEKFRTNLRILRAGTKISGVELARKLGIKSGSRITEIEYGKGTPTMEEVVLLSKYFGVSLDDLMDKNAVIKFE